MSDPALRRRGRPEAGAGLDLAAVPRPLQEVGGSYYRYYDCGYGRPGGCRDGAGLRRGWWPAPGRARPATWTPWILRTLRPMRTSSNTTTRTAPHGRLIVGAGASSLSISRRSGLDYEYDNDGRSRGVGINAWSQETTIISAEQHDARRLYELRRRTDAQRADRYGDTVNPARRPDLEHLLRLRFAGPPGPDRRALRAGTRPTTRTPTCSTNSPGSYQLMSSSQGLIEGIDYYGTLPATRPATSKTLTSRQARQASTKALQDYYNMRRSVAEAFPSIPFPTTRSSPPRLPTSSDSSGKRHAFRLLQTRSSTSRRSPKPCRCRQSTGRTPWRNGHDHHRLRFQRPGRTTSSTPTATRRPTPTTTRPARLRKTVAVVNLTTERDDHHQFRARPAGPARPDHRRQRQHNEHRLRRRSLAVERHHDARGGADAKGA